jgi:peptide chain release factor subunit 1
MNITLAIPEGKEYKNKLKHELSVASNIKSKQTRDSITQGLRKILEAYSPGNVYLWNGEKLWSHPYPLNEFIYHCGPDFMVPEKPSGSKYLLITMDANNCTIGLLSGKRITTLWDHESNVPRKHNKGGQSKARFQRERQNQLGLWFKKIAMKVQEVASL